MTETLIEGLLLFFIGLALIGLEIVMISFGALLLAGLVVAGYGLYVLMQDPTAAMIVGNPALLAGALAGCAGLVGLAVFMAFRAYRHKTHTGREGMIGQRVTVCDWSGTRGTVLFEGEQWKARSATPLSAHSGEELTITAIDGMVLSVASLSSST